MNKRTGGTQRPGPRMCTPCETWRQTLRVLHRSQKAEKPHLTGRLFCSAN